MTKDELESAIKVANLWAGRSTLVLAVGILGEYALLPFLEKKRWHFPAKMFFAVLVVAGIVGEYRFSSQISQNADELQRLSDAELRDATDKAGKAIERAAKLELQTLVLQKELSSQSRRANVIDDPDRWMPFVARLARFPKQRFDVRWCPNPDSEIVFFSLSLEGKLTWANWVLGDSAPWGGCEVGMSLMLHPRASDATKSAAAALKRALYEAGLIASPTPQWQQSADRPVSPGNTLLFEPSGVDSILIEVGSHP